MRFCLVGHVSVDKRLQDVLSCHPENSRTGIFFRVFYDGYYVLNIGEIDWIKTRKIGKIHIQGEITCLINQYTDNKSYFCQNKGSYYSPTLSRYTVPTKLS